MGAVGKKKLAARIGIVTTAITLVGMTLLWLVVSTNTAAMVKNDITNQMTDAVEARAVIIDDYVRSAEEYMTAFALGSEVRELLLEPDDPALTARAQRYTEEFAAVKGVFEGLYIATPDTHVLTHTSQGAIGMTTRSGDSLRSFQDTILATRELTNLGIMKSPGTGSMILSMYCPVYENGRCIGYVGAGVYAESLMDALLDLDIKGLPNSEYVFLNVDTGVYLYHEDEALLNTETADKGYQEIVGRIRADGGTQANTYSYRDEGGVSRLVVYKYLKDRGWVFMVRNSAAQVYGAVTTVRVLVGALCAAMAAAVILITLLILRREGRDLMVVERAIGRLGDLNLSADQELEAFYGRTDEVGMIAQTTHRVCGALRETIDDVGRILGEMAQGDLAVDVTKNEALYIGDFKVLSASLQSIQANLVDVIRDISQVAGQVDASAERVSAGAQALAQGTTEQASSIEGLVTNVTAITSQIQTSAVRCGSAAELVDRATGYAAEADTKMDQLTQATRNIDQSSAQIGTIIEDHRGHRFPDQHPGAERRGGGRPGRERGQGLLRGGRRGAQPGRQVRPGRPEHQRAHRPLHPGCQDGDGLHRPGRVRHAGDPGLRAVHQGADGRDRRRQRAAVGDDRPGGERHPGDLRRGAEQLLRRGEERRGVQGALQPGQDPERPDRPLPRPVSPPEHPAGGAPWQISPAKPSRRAS